MSAPEPADLAPWGIRPFELTGVPHGLNNDSYFVRAAEGDFVLRVYRNTADPERVRDEHDLLARLALADLPFATPVPLGATTGDTVAVLETPGGPRLAALFPRIPGEPAALDAVNARLAGRALALLDRAFAGFDLPVRAPAALRDVHPLVPDPIAMLDELDVDAGHPLRRLFDAVVDAHDALVASLPRQIVHGDFAFPNVLVDDRQVTGMLDFEFAGADLRAGDMAAALYVIAVRAPESERWRLLDAFAAGYRDALPLDMLEIAALPALMQRRAAIGLVHWAGRWRAGIAPKTEPLERVDRGTRFARWLDESAPRLLVLVAEGERSRRRDIGTS